MGEEESQLTGSTSSMYVVSGKPSLPLCPPAHITSRSLSYAGQAEIVTSICENLASPVAGLPFESIPPFSESEALTRLWTAA